jgi:hypothetical protein
VRRAALEHLCELEGPEAALRRARPDSDATVRAWRPASSAASPRLLCDPLAAGRPTTVS